MNSAVKISGLLLLEVLLLALGKAGLSSDMPQFVAVGYVAIACMIVAPFLATNRLRSLTKSAR